MVAIVIVTIIGIICIVVSFLLVSKDEPVVSGDGEVARQITDDYELDEEEVAILQRKVSDRVSQDVNDIIYQADQSLSSISNEKMIALGDYAVTVCDEIEKNHKEVMFLYSMLNDKEKELKELVSDAEVRASDLRKANEEALDTYIKDVSVEEETMEEDVLESESEDLFDDSEETLLEEEDNTNDIILEMHKNGMSIMEIAKELGMGVGEVKLIVDLYQGETE